jgi:hypothetical protein
MWNMQPLHARVSAKWRKNAVVLDVPKSMENFAQLVLMPLRLLVNGVNLAMRDCGKYFDRAGNNLALTLFCGSARLSCPPAQARCCPAPVAPARGFFLPEWRSPNSFDQRRSYE